MTKYTLYVCYKCGQIFINPPGETKCQCGGKLTQTGWLVKASTDDLTKEMDD